MCLKHMLKVLTSIVDHYDTPCEICIGENVPSDLLLERPWQTKNHVSIVEKQTGTHLEFHNKDSDEIQYEVCVSFIEKEPPAKRKPYSRKPLFHCQPSPQTYALTTLQVSYWIDTSRFYFDLDHHQDQVISELHKTLDTAILVARRISQKLDLLPLRETYFVLGNLETRMFFQLLQKYRNNWDVPDYRLPKCLQSVEATIDADIVDFLTKMESATWEHKLTDTLGPGKSQNIYTGQIQDLMQFLEIALQGI